MRTALTVIIAIVVIALIGAGIYYYTSKPAPTETPNEETGEAVPEQATTTPQVGPIEVIGQSAGGRDITAYHYGSGDTELLFVGGIHGGYEWNTVLVARELMNYLDANPSSIPANEKVTVIPVLNPDGLAKVVSDPAAFTVSDVANDAVPGRFNGNNVDLNRNFDCDWQTNGTWQNKTVSGGSAAFSEPESAAVRAYVTAHNPKAVVVWYSAAGGVFASNCHNGVLPETQTLTDLYAKASGYKAYQSFDFYEITGDMVNWLAKNGTPAISVLLTNHTSTEWDKNQKGVDAVLAHYAQ